MLQRRSYSKRFISAHEPKPKPKLHDPIRPPTKITSKCSEAQKQIPKIINELERNLKLLKKYYDEDQNFTQGSIQNIKKKVKPKQIAKTKSQLKLPQIQDITSPEIDEIRRSFLNANGYESNNLIELYNFYKKSVIGSTRIYGSMSMNSMNNYSDLRDQPKKQNQQSLINQNRTEEIDREKSKSKQTAKSSVSVTDLVKNGCELVNVASLLAAKKRTNKQDKSVPNFQQYKRKLVRPNTNENIERFNQTKQSLKLQNKQTKKNISYEKKNTSISREQEVETKKQRKNMKSPKNISSLLEKQDQIVSPNICKVSSSKKRSSSKKKSQKKSSNKKRMNEGVLFGILNSNSRDRVLKTQKSEIEIKPFKEGKEESFLGSEIMAKSCSKVLDLDEIPFQF